MLRSNASNLAKKNRARRAATLRELKSSVQRFEFLVHRTAQTLSAGPYKTTWLAAQARRRGAGLYSVRSPSPPADPGIINLQTGRFAASWDTTAFVSINVQIVVLFNDSPEAKWMHGTTKMIARPILLRIHEREDRRFFAMMRAAKARGLRG